jgi:hypothetical protein
MLKMGIAMPVAHLKITRGDLDQFHPVLAVQTDIEDWHGDQVRNLTSVWRGAGVWMRY